MSLLFDCSCQVGGVFDRAGEPVSDFPVCGPDVSYVAASDSIVIEAGVRA